MAHGGAEVERSLAAVAPLAGQPDGQLAGERLQRLAQRHQLVAGGVHHVDVLGQWLAQRPGQRLAAPVGHQAPPDLVLDLLAEPIDAGLVLVAQQPLLERGERGHRGPGLGGRVVVERRGRGPGRIHQPVQHPVEVEVPQRPVEVVGPPDRSTRLHPRVAGHRLSGHRGHHGVVGPEQRLVEQVGELLGGHALLAATTAAPTLAPPVARAGHPLRLELGAGRRSRRTPRRSGTRGPAGRSRSRRPSRTPSSGTTTSPGWPRGCT